MQIEGSFAAAYDFNQDTQYVPAPALPSPADFDPFPAPHCGEEGFPAPRKKKLPRPSLVFTVVECKNSVQTIAANILDS